MSISADVLQKMVKAGCTAEQLVAIVRADEEHSAEHKAKVREQNRIRQQKHRARNAMSRVTERDLLDGLEGSSSTPPSPKTLNPQSPSSLRSSGDARVHEEFHENFWPAYPHKVGKQEAERAFAKARRQAPLSAMLAGLKSYIDTKPAERPWLNPATWLNGCRWNDQPAAVAPRSQGPPGFRTSDSILATLKRHLDDDDDETSHHAGNHQDVDNPLLSFAAKGHDRE